MFPCPKSIHSVLHSFIENDKWTEFTQKICLIFHSHSLQYSTSDARHWRSAKYKSHMCTVLYVCCYYGVFGVYVCMYICVYGYGIQLYRQVTFQLLTESISGSIFLYTNTPIHNTRTHIIITWRRGYFVKVNNLVTRRQVPIFHQQSCQKDKVEYSIL